MSEEKPVFVVSCDMSACVLDGVLTRYDFLMARGDGACYEGRPRAGLGERRECGEFPQGVEIEGMANTPQRWTGQMPRTS